MKKIINIRKLDFFFKKYKTSVFLFVLYLGIHNFSFSQTTLCSTYGAYHPNFTWSGSPKQSSTLSSSYTSQVIVINSDFEVNSNITFNSCIIKIASGAKITVDASHILTFNSCAIFSCGSFRWDGIDVSSLGYLVMTSSQIEDADIAVKGHQHSLIKLTGNYFNRNAIGVANQTNDVYAFVFTNNLIDCTSALLWPEPDQIPYNWSVFGMKFENTAMTVGIDDISFLNEFKNLNIGIYSKNSAVAINGCYFHDMIENNVKTISYSGGGTPSNDSPKSLDYLGVMGGSGIWANDGIIHITGLTSTGSNYTFWNNQRDGITTLNGVKLTCLHARFSENYLRGISMTKTNASSFLTVKNCEFITTPGHGKGGILAEKPPGSKGMSSYNIISQNTFNLETGTDISDPSSFGILIDGINNGQEHMSIDNNTFNLNGGRSFGISYSSVNGTDFTNFSDNIIIPGTASDNTAAGMQFLFGNGMGTNNTVYRNNISAESIDDGSDLYIGIQLYDCPQIHFCHNEIQGANIGYSISAMNISTDFNTNIIGDNSKGIYAFNGSVLGPQICKANEFHLPLSDYFDKAALADYSGVQSNSPFIINPDEVAQDPTGSVSYPNWFVPSNDCKTNMPPETCSIFETNDNFTPEITEFDRSLSKGEFSGDGGASFLFEAKIQVYNRFFDHYDIYSTFDTLNTFMDDNENSLIGILSAVDHKIYEGMAFPSSIENNYNAINSSLKTRLTQLNTLDSTMNLCLSAMSTFIPSRDTITDSIAYHLTNLDIQYEAYKDTLNEKLNDALDMLRYASPSITCEINAVIVRSIHLRSIIYQNGILTGGQIDTLITIAEQCPANGGHGVAYAQALLPDSTIYAKWPIYLTCGGDTVRENKIINPYNETQIKIYPNPSSGEISILSNDLIKSLYIYNSEGKLIKAVNQIFNTKYDFNIQETGIYLLKINDMTDKSQLKKIIIKK